VELGKNAKKVGQVGQETFSTTETPVAQGVSACPTSCPTSPNEVGQVGQVGQAPTPPAPPVWRLGARLSGGRRTIHTTDGKQTRIVDPDDLPDYGLTA
jgi:hypothetical protein